MDPQPGAATSAADAPRNAIPLARRMHRGRDMSRRLSVLVVDDDPSMRQMLVEILELAGFDAGAACDVEEALHRLEDGSYAAIVSDIHMGARTGFDLVHEVRSTRRRTRVILMSAFGGDATSRLASEAGADGYLTKPFDPDELIGLLRRAASR